MVKFLLEDVPPLWQPQIRLGLQEALVNAVYHGNQLDPCKKVTGAYSVHEDLFAWVVTDQGVKQIPGLYSTCQIPSALSEEGRGIYIIHQIFDRVQWDHDRHALYLEKLITPHSRPLIL